MKKQIKRLSPHQNGKIFGLLMAVASIAFLIPMFLLMFYAGQPVDVHGNAIPFPKFMIILFPVLYFIFGYLGVAVSCLIYNFIFKYVGGFEFEMESEVEN